MLDWLRHFIETSLEAFQFWCVVNDYERGVVLRFGRFHREIEPGFHWIIPFHVERPILDNAVPRTMNLGAQSVTTQDGKQVVVACIVTARIHNIRTALLEVEAVDDALRDSCYAAVAQTVSGTTWERLSHENLTDELTAAARKAGWKWGMEIQRVQLSDFALSRSLRLWQQA